MKPHEFTVVLKAEPNDDEAEQLYSAFDDGTISTISGVPQIQFHREAESLEDAIRSAAQDVRSAGFQIERVELQPDMLPV